jgi:hypothetical protein
MFEMHLMDAWCGIFLALADNDLSKIHQVTLAMPAESTVEPPPSRHMLDFAFCICWIDSSSTENQIFFLDTQHK